MNEKGRGWNPRPISFMHTGMKLPDFFKTHLFAITWLFGVYFLALAVDGISQMLFLLTWISIGLTIYHTIIDNPELKEQDEKIAALKRQYLPIGIKLWLTLPNEER